MHLKKMFFSLYISIFNNCPPKKEYDLDKF